MARLRLPHQALTAFCVLLIYLLLPPQLYSSPPRAELAASGLEFTADALVERAGAGDLDAVRLYLAAGMDVDARECCFSERPVTHSSGEMLYRARTALMAAAQSGNRTVVLYLLDQGADPNARSNGRDFALNYAAQGGHMEIVRLLLAHGADANAQTEEGVSPVMHAAIAGDLEMARVLVASGASVSNAGTRGASWTPLMYAALLGHREMVKFLLEHGADVNAAQKGFGSDTALDKTNDAEITGLLRAAGGKRASELR